MNRGKFRESDSSEETQLGRFRGLNRFGEERIRHDSYQDDQFHEYGLRSGNRWSEDSRSESFHESHFGKGPKGYERSQARIEEEACELLSRNRDLDASELCVTVKDRCLYLTGEVSTRHAKRLAEYLVEDISGIDDVQNKIRITGVNYGN